MAVPLTHELFSRKAIGRINYTLPEMVAQKQSCCLHGFGCRGDGDLDYDDDNNNGPAELRVRVKSYRGRFRLFGGVIPYKKSGKIQIDRGSSIEEVLRKY